MLEVVFVIVVILIVSVVRYRTAGYLSFLPMLICIVFIGALFKNLLDAMTYLANHPQLGGNQVGWFPGYWPVLFLTALAIIVGTPIYFELKTRKLKAAAKATQEAHHDRS
jgi:hypothetical protein